MTGRVGESLAWLTRAYRSRVGSSDRSDEAVPSGGTAPPEETDSQGCVREPSIDVEGCAVSLGGTEILSGVSLRVDPGEFVGLVGPNGAGKTTLLRTISGVHAPTAGSVTVAGVDVHAVASKRASRVLAVVPQETALSFSFPVRDVVAMGRYPHRSRFSTPSPDDRDAVDRALERTTTMELADRPIDAVSGGERQRVLIARALAQETRVLLLDEPTASLDVNHRVEVLSLVRELVADGHTVLAAIHDLEMAARWCDRLAVLADGTITECGDPEAVLTRETLESAFDATAVVATEPTTGTPHVTAYPRAEEPAFKGRTGR